MSRSEMICGLIIVWSFMIFLGFMYQMLDKRYCHDPVVKERVYSECKRLNGSSNMSCVDAAERISTVKCNKQ